MLPLLARQTGPPLHTPHSTENPNHPNAFTISSGTRPYTEGW